MSSAAPTPQAYQRVIIHHLSDLHYQQTRSSNDNPLTRYMGYLDQLEPAKRPVLLVITGDLTATGDANDLRTVAELLRNRFPAWAGDLASHIFVVPGPRDINWEGADAPGLKPFYEAFHDFGLPSPARALPTHGANARTPLPCIAYPLDTCYSLDECRAEMKEQFHQYGSTYHDFVKQFQQVRSRNTGPLSFMRRDRKAELAALQERYLNLTETNDLMLLDAGRVAAGDLAAFARWVDSQGASQSGTDGSVETLKILITHHPLAVQPEMEHGQDEVQRAAAREKDAGFEQLARAAGRGGFHLALHGHIHKPQVLSDLSLLREADARHPMRQVGAGSLGDGKTFNEITGVYAQDGEQNHWRLEIRTINLKAQNPHETTAWVLLNRTEDAAKRVEELERAQGRRAEFDERVQSVMHQFSESVHRTQPEDAFDRSIPELLPQAALQTVDSIIQKVVFPGFDVRSRLYLKDKQATKVIPRLSAFYLNASFGDAAPVAYPHSLAALALVLGRTLVYPDDLDARLDERDYQWLRRSGKDRELGRILEALIREPPPTGSPAPEAAQRYQALLTKLNQGMADDGRAYPLTGMDFAYDAPGAGARPAQPVVIHVPYPQRPPEGNGPDVPEVAVLVVSARAPDEHPETQTAQPAEQAASPERRGMLASLAQLIGMILISSSAIGKPRGVWDDRIKP